MLGATGSVGAEARALLRLWDISGCTPSRNCLLLSRGSEVPGISTCQSLGILLGPPECCKVIPPENTWAFVKLNRKSVLLAGSSMGKLPKS